MRRLKRFWGKSRTKPDEIASEEQMQVGGAGNRLCSRMTASAPLRTAAFPVQSGRFPKLAGT
jgi:hypothetical protein